MTDGLAPGTLIDGRYQLYDRQEDGGFGEVWRATDTRLSGRAVSMRFLNREFAPRGDLVARYEAEAQALAQQQSPGGPGVLDRGEWRGQRYLVTEYVAGLFAASMPSSPGIGAPPGHGAAAPSPSRTVVMDSMSAGLAPQPGFAPQQGGYPPQQAGYAPQQGGYPPPQGGFAPQPSHAPGFAPYGAPPAQHNPFGYQSGPPGPALPPGFGASSMSSAPRGAGSFALTAGIIAALMVGLAGIVAWRVLRTNDATEASVPSTTPPAPNGLGGFGNQGMAGGGAYGGGGYPGTAGSPTTPQADSPAIPVGGAPMLGNPGALATLVVFDDFECPFCARVEPTLTALRARYGNDLRIVWRNNPLPFHPNAMAAAEAAMEAYTQQGAPGFWALHDTLFQNQRALTRFDLERYASLQGLDPVRFRAALDSHVHQPAIQADMALARGLSATGTPNFFINGTNLTGAQPVERFVALIDQVLAQARTITPPTQAYLQMVRLPIPSPTPPRAAAPSPAAPDLGVYRAPVEGAPSIGSPLALVTLVEYTDFQCPFCARVQPTIAQLRARYGEDLRIVFRNNPLAFHTNALPAAEAAMEAFAQRGNVGFWRMHDVLFLNQRALERFNLEGYGEQAGLHVGRLRAALDMHVHEPRIRADMALGASIGVQGTPHFFINGRRLSGAQPVERFVEVIEAQRAMALEALRTPGVNRANLYDYVTRPTPGAPAYRTP